MNTADIFQRELAGEVISLNDPEYPKIAALITEAQRVIAEMNTGYRDLAQVRALFSRLTGTEVDEPSGCCRRSIPTSARTSGWGGTCSSTTPASSWTAAASPSATTC
jgi:hypothetical protein